MHSLQLIYGGGALRHCSFPSVDRSCPCNENPRQGVEGPAQPGGGNATEPPKHPAHRLKFS